MRKKRGFKTRKEAYEYLPTLAAIPATMAKDLTFTQLYEKWLPVHEADVNPSTMNCYKAAYKHFEPIWFVRMSELRTEQMQECLDGCGKGKRTQENMKALATMLYSYADEHDLVTKNYAQFLRPGGGQQEPREPFTDAELQTMFAKVGEVPNLDMVLILCYTGFRLDEFLSLTGESLHHEIEPDGSEWYYFVGGEKTEAGRDRVVAISPKILPYVLARYQTGTMFPGGKKVKATTFRNNFYYPALEAAGLPKRVPHCCRHTYATLMKNVETVSETDKLASIGHKSMDVTKKYTHADLQSQRRLAESL